MRNKILFWSVRVKSNVSTTHNGPQNESTPHGGRKLLRGSHITTVDLQLARYLWEEYVALAEKYPEVKKSVLHLMCISVGLSQIPDRQLSTNCTRMGRRCPSPPLQRPLLTAGLYTTSSSSCNGRTHRWTARCVPGPPRKPNTSRRCMRRLSGLSLLSSPGYVSTVCCGLDKQGRLTYDGQYSNYGGEDADLVAVFGDNLGRLRALKERYDPGNVFRKWQSLFPEAGAE